jgi:hypothetical protein
MVFGVCVLDEELREGQRFVLKLSECGVVRKECERCVLGCAENRKVGLLYMHMLIRIV